MTLQVMRRAGAVAILAVGAVAIAVGALAERGGELRVIRHRTAAPLVRDRVAWRG